MTITDLFIATPFILFAYALWQHNSMSAVARAAAKNHCENQGVQLLDQNVILRSLSIGRSPHSLFAVKREFSFEFSSVGDYRYLGKVYLLGTRVKLVELAPFKME